MPSDLSVRQFRQSLAVLGLAAMTTAGAQAQSTQCYHVIDALPDAPTALCPEYTICVSSKKEAPKKDNCEVTFFYMPKSKSGTECTFEALDKNARTQCQTDFKIEVVSCDRNSHVLFFLRAANNYRELEYLELGNKKIKGWCFDNAVGLGGPGSRCDIFGKKVPKPPKLPVCSK